MNMNINKTDNCSLQFNFIFDPSEVEILIKKCCNHDHSINIMASLKRSRIPMQVQNAKLSEIRKALMVSIWHLSLTLNGASLQFS